MSFIVSFVSFVSFVAFVAFVSAMSFVSLVSLVATVVIPHPFIAPATAKAAVLTVPIVVATGGNTGQGARDPAPIHPIEVVMGRARAEPAVGPPAPIPTALEENFILESRDHLHSGSHDHQVGTGGQSDFDANVNLGLSRGGAQEECEPQG